MTATEKPSSRRPKSNELRLADGEIAHVGVDVDIGNWCQFIFLENLGKLRWLDGMSRLPEPISDGFVYLPNTRGHKRGPVFLDATELEK